MRKGAYNPTPYNHMNTPEEMGFALTINAGPTVQLSPWDTDTPRHVVTFQCAITRNDKPVWSGPYYLGWGHIDRAHVKKALHEARLDPEEYPAKTILAQGADAKWLEPAKSVPQAVAILQRAATLQRLKPDLSGVLSSLVSDGAAFFDSQTFPQWCDEYGSNPDSIKARDTWQTCDEIGRKLAGACKASELVGLREWANNI